MQYFFTFKILSITEMNEEMVFLPVIIAGKQVTEVKGRVDNVSKGYLSF